MMISIILVNTTMNVQNCSSSLLIGTKFLGFAHCAIYGPVWGGPTKQGFLVHYMMLFFLDAYFFFFCRCASFISVFFYARWCDIRGRSKTTLTSFWLFLTYVDSIYLIRHDIFGLTTHLFL